MNRIIGLLISFLAFTILVSPSYAQKERKKVQEGNAFFSEENYEDALSKYRDAALDNPESPIVQYNIGNALYKQGKFDEAFAEFEKVLSSDEADMHFRSYYNMGNSLYKMEKLEESIKSYIKALQLDPDDFEAKHNLEYVRSKLKQEENQNEDGEDQQDQKQDQNQEQNEQDQQQNQEQQDQNEQDQKEKEPQAQDQKPMTKEQAEQLLNALLNDEKDLQRKNKKQFRGKIRVLKDW